MLIDTNQIITKTQLRENLTDLLMLVKKGKELVVSDRGKLIAKMMPVDKKETEVFDVIKETHTLRKKLSRQNPNFDSLKALREMRDES